MRVTERFVVVFMGVLCFWATAGEHLAAVSVLRSIIATLLVGVGVIVAARLSRPMPRVGSAAVILTALGAGWQARFSGSLDRGVIAVVAVIAGIALGGFFGRWAMERASRTSAIFTGLVLCIVTIIVRAASTIQGYSASGAIVILGRSLHVGELIRIVFIVGTGLLLSDSSRVVAAMQRGGVSWRGRLHWAAILLLPSMMLLLTFVALKDIGPAVVTAVAIAAMMYRGLGMRYIIIPFIASALGVIIAAPHSSALVGRWKDMLDPGGHGRGQLGIALRALGDSGFINIRPSKFLGSLPAATSDYAPASIGASVGMLVLLAALMVAMAIPVFLLRATTKLIELPAFLATGCAVLLFVPTLWTGLGNLGIVPFSGIDVPFIAADGTSTLGAAVTLGVGLAAVAATSRARPDCVPRPGRNLFRMVAVATVTALTIAGVQATRLAATGGPVLIGETFLQPRGAVSSSDGQLIAPAVSARGHRAYTDPMYASVGWLTPGDAAGGFEWLGSGSETCGVEHNFWDRALHFGIPSDCDAATTVTTFDSRYQRVASQAAAANGATLIAVSDTQTGQVLAAASSDPAPRPLGTAPSMPVFTQSLVPGSTFKMVTGTAAELAHVPARSVGKEYKTGSTVVRNEWLGPCPGIGTIAMLAYSCNTIAAADGDTVGRRQLQATAAAFGFGQNLALTGPPYRPRDNRPLAWTTNTATTGLTTTSGLGDVALASFGQGGVRASVWDMNYATDIVATAGKVPAATMIAGTCTGTTFHPWTAPSKNGAIARAGLAGTTTRAFATSSAVVYRGMLLAVRRGTASRLASVLPGHEIAAKTGTAQTGSNAQQTISWLTLVIDRKTTITIAVLPQSGRPRPDLGPNAAIDVAQELLHTLPARSPAALCPQ